MFIARHSISHWFDYFGKDIWFSMRVKTQSECQLTNAHAWMSVCSDKTLLPPFLSVGMCLHFIRWPTQISDSQNFITDWLQDHNTAIIELPCRGTFEMCLDQEPKMLPDFPHNDSSLIWGCTGYNHQTPESNLRPSCWEVTVLTAVPPAVHNV